MRDVGQMGDRRSVLRTVAHLITSLACGSLPTWPDMTRYLVGSCCGGLSGRLQGLLRVEAAFFAPAAKSKVGASVIRSSAIYDLAYLLQLAMMYCDGLFVCFRRGERASPNGCRKILQLRCPARRGRSDAAHCIS